MQILNFGLLSRQGKCTFCHRKRKHREYARNHTVPLKNAMHPNALRGQLKYFLKGSYSC